MKVVHISTSDSGGAGVAAVRLHNALLKAGIQSSLLTKLKHIKNIQNHYQLNPETLTNRILVRAGIKRNKYRTLEMKHLANRPEGFEKFSFPFSEIDLTTHYAIKEADVIHLHWVSDRFLDFESFFKKNDKPVLWTLHDMNPFTGGCHHADDCSGFENDCFHCPQLKKTIDENFAEKILTNKKKALENISADRFKVTAPSQWLINLSKRSVLFSKYQHHVIPNIVDADYSAFQIKVANRKELNLPTDRKILLFAVNDISHHRKGFTYLNDALKLIDKDILVCGAGRNSSKIAFANFIDLGYVKDKSLLAKIYNAADVLVVPSLAENFPNTICESLLTGTPVVAFNIGGIPELIDNSNGRLAEFKNSNSLANSISFVLKNPGLFNKERIGMDAQMKFDTVKIVNQYVEVYQSLLKR